MLVVAIVADRVGMTLYSNASLSKSGKLQHFSNRFEVWKRAGSQRGGIKLELDRERRNCADRLGALRSASERCGK